MGVDQTVVSPCLGLISTVQLNNPNMYEHMLMMYNLSNDHNQDYCTTAYGKVEVQYDKNGLFKWSLRNFKKVHVKVIQQPWTAVFHPVKLTSPY
jgi:dihydroxyacetone kinase-like predicted kinase